MTEEDEYRLAERLAEAMGMELQEIKTRSDVVRVETPNGLSVGNLFKNEVLRGQASKDPDWGRCGLMDIGTAWECGFSLPFGLTKDSTDEEIDLRLTAMGF